MENSTSRRSSTPRTRERRGSVTGNRLELWTMEELAEQLRMTTGSARRLCRRGRVPGAIKLGARWFVRKRLFLTYREATPDQIAASPHLRPRVKRSRWTPAMLDRLRRDD